MNIKMEKDKSLVKITEEHARALFVKDLKRWFYLAGVSSVVSIYSAFQFGSENSMAQDALNSTLIVIGGLGMAVGLSEMYGRTIEYLMNCKGYFKQYHKAEVVADTDIE